MSDCKRIGALITSYVDDALEASSRADVDQHISACRGCRDHVTRERGARAAVRQCAETLTNQPLPPGLESRGASIVREPAASGRTTGWLARLLPVGGAVLLVVAGIGLLAVLTGRSNAVLAAQLAADHVKCFAVFAPRAATGEDARGAERQLASYGWNMRVPPSSPEHGLRLLGVRRCLSGAGEMPHVMYDVNGTHVSLFKFNGVEHGTATVTSLGHQCRIWQRDGCTFVLVGPDAAGPELTQIARYVEEQAR